MTIGMVEIDGDVNKPNNVLLIFFFLPLFLYLIKWNLRVTLKVASHEHILVDHHFLSANDTITLLNVDRSWVSF